MNELRGIDSVRLRFIDEQCLGLKSELLEHLISQTSTLATGEVPMMFENHPSIELNEVASRLLDVMDFESAQIGLGNSLTRDVGGLTRDATGFGTLVLFPDRRLFKGHRVRSLQG
jgi:hypothetical protein